MRRSTRPTASSGGRGRLAVNAAPATPNYAFGDRAPGAVFAPERVEQLAAALRACDAKGHAVVLFGGGTLQSLGHAPARYDVAIDLRALDKLLEYEFRDLTISVEAGMSVEQLTATLAERGQFVALDAPQAARSTVGGILASGWGGPRRATYGRPRDALIGTTIVLADGTIAKAGGMVVKNVTGYDMSKLYCGSFGTLGAIVRANFKTLPAPPARRVAIARLPERTHRHVIENIAALDVEPAAALVVQGFADDIDGRDGADGRIFLLFEGSQALVDRSTRELRSALGAAGVPETTLFDAGAGTAFSRLLDAYLVRLGDRSVTYRCLGLPNDLLRRWETVARLAQTHELALETLQDIRTGDLIARVSATLSGHLAERIAGFDAELHLALPSIHVLTAPEPLRGGLAMWGAPPSSLETMRALKKRFDPNGTLAPGRFVGGI
jgi:glycolate oxidase FAD binding subunit